MADGWDERAAFHGRRTGCAGRRADVRPALREHYAFRTGDRLSRRGGGAAPASGTERLHQAHVRIRPFDKLRAGLGPSRSPFHTHQIRTIAGAMAGVARWRADRRRRTGSVAASARTLAYWRTAAAGAAEPRRAPAALPPRPVRGSARAGSVRARDRTSVAAAGDLERAGGGGGVLHAPGLVWVSLPWARLWPLRHVLRAAGGCGGRAVRFGAAAGLRFAGGGVGGDDHRGSASPSTSDATRPGPLAL